MTSTNIQKPDHRVSTKSSLNNIASDPISDEIDLIKLQSEILSLRTSLGIANQEILHWKERAERRHKNLVWALIPWLLVILPISFPLWVTYEFRQRKRRHTNLFKKKLRENRGVVVEAFNRFQVEGLFGVSEFLETKKEFVEPETYSLFQSAAAETDAEWLQHFNKFLGARKEEGIILKSGNLDRFNRISFASRYKVKDGPKISVIMSSFNSEDTVELAVKSILNQSWNNLELIVIDDCSTDMTWQILQTLAESDSRMKIRRQSINSGPYVAKNIGLSLASGDYVTGQDADDIAMPNRLERQIAPLLDDTSKQASLGEMIRLDPHGRFSHASRIGSFSRDGIARIASISLLIERRILVDRLGFWDTARFGADSEMIARAIKLLGDKLVFQNELTMLCLDAAANLTNNPETGIRLATGISPVRVEYRDAWQAWHKATPIEQRKLPFPHVGQDRKFAIPEAMMVSDEAVDAIKTQVVLGDKLGKSDKVV